MSNLSISHWRAGSGPGAAGAGVTVGGGVEVCDAAEAVGLVGQLMEPLRCPHMVSPFNLMAQVNQISKMAQFSPEGSSFGTLVGRVFEVVTVAVVMMSNKCG